MTPSGEQSVARSARAEALFHDSYQRLCRRTDHLFGGLLIVQWIAAVAAAIWLSPRTWIGSESEPHIHVWLAVLLGAVTVAVPLYLIATRAGSTVSRHAVGFAEGIMSALLIHVTGGRIETHFHVFGTLAFLAFYRDWKVLITNSAVVAVDHLVRGFYAPQSIYGLFSPSEWRWLEHAGWVIFEDLFLIHSCRVSMREMRETSDRHAELEQTNAHIERVVIERTAELERARDDALSAARAKSEFLANMSHELRTPIHGILGMNGLLLSSDLSKDDREYARTAHACADSLLVIVNDILDFSKIEAGRLELDFTDFHLRELLEDITAMLAEGAQAKGLELASMVDDSLPDAIHADSTRVRQILVNLVGNAVKFTEEGEVIVRAKLVNRSGSSFRMRIEVADTGIGISQESIGKLFRAFTQADGSTTRKFGGTGLGLTISRRLAELMGGTIGIESELGKGSTFWFEIEVEDAKSDIEERPRGQAELRGKHVLVVDDNATNREILRHQLERWGMTQEAYADGASTLDRLRAAATGVPTFQLGIIDFQMPGMDGLELAEQIRDDPDIAGIPLICLTSIGTLLPNDQAWAADIRAQVHKPTRERQLLDTIARVLQEEEAGEAAAKAESGVQKDAAASEAADPESPASNHFRVLLAEDNVVNQTVAGTVLRKAGYQVDIAGNGQEAIDLLAEKDYDLVLMDCQMPVLDGYQATRRIRRMEGSAALPIIAMTANAMEGDRERCMEHGMDGYLPKPISGDDLLKALDLWLGSERAAQSRNALRDEVGGGEGVQPRSPTST